MWKFIKVFIAGIAVSCYFFPFEFTFLPGVNTKMAMAGVGLVLYVLDLAKGRAPQINKDGFIIAVLGVLVSLCGLLSVIVNNTNDYTYASYFVSMFVWLGGAYTAIKILKWLHGYVSVELVCNYLIGVCVGQCILALIIDSVPAFKETIDSYILGFDFVDTERLTQASRLYGVGAALDVAGTRFSSVLVIIVVMLNLLSRKRNMLAISLYLIAFVFIAIVGNMMARTTTIGVIIALSYLLLTSGILNVSLRKGRAKIWLSLIGVICVTIPIVIYLYSTNQQFYDNIRFGFEGFFSIAETGKWETNSNNILKNMIVFPDNWKTWIIGDGYFDNPTFRDPYYVGPPHGGFYKNTDIGYLRFIFYFGVVGLITFVIYFCKITTTCIERFPGYSVMFILLLAINMIVWLKVSTDIFVVFAIFLCLPSNDSRIYETSIPNPLNI